MLGLVVLVGTIGPGAGNVPALSVRANTAVGRTYCDHFGNWVKGISCREQNRVWRRYEKVCVPASLPVTSRLPRCQEQIYGFRCTPTGNAYAFIYCHRNRARMGFHIAE
jgi:hypothetical protein